MKETKNVECLKEYLDIILQLDNKTYLDKLIENIKENLFLVGVSENESSELYKRDSFSEYCKFITEQIDEDFELFYDLKEYSEKWNSYYEDDGQPIHGKNTPEAFNDLKPEKMVIPGDRFFYRGQYDSGKGMRTGVYRGDTYKRENVFYHEMLVRCTEDFKHTTNLDKLTIMQHYGCPTRLLDITSNPLVALYFACKNFGCDKCGMVDEGIVYIFLVESGNMVYADSDRALILSALPKFDFDDKQKILEIASSNIKKQSFPKNSDGLYRDKVIERLYHEICCESLAFERKIKPIDLVQPLFIQPNKNNRRILKQDGAFILTGLSNDGVEEQGKLEMLSPIHVKVTNKKEILNELNQIGINEASLFPEMDHVASYLKSNGY